MRAWAAVAVVVMSMGACTGGRDESASTSVSIASSTSAEVVLSTTTSTTTSSTTTLANEPVTAAPQPFVLTRPVFDSNVCTPTAAWAERRENATVTGPLWPFARASAFAISMQVVGDRELGAAAPFAMVLRYGERRGQLDVTDRVGDWDVRVGVYANGNGEAFWDLADGGEGYVRSRGLTHDDIVEIVAALTPRADIGDGFDVDVDRLGSGRGLLAEGTNVDLPSLLGTGTSATSWCRMGDDGPEWRLSAFRSAPLVEYWLILDRPAPIHVGVIGDRVVLISGPAGLASSAPALTDIIQADAAVWAELLTHPPGA